MATQNDTSRSVPGSDWINSRRRRFSAWRRQRPFMGGVLLCLAGIIITWVPMQILPDLIFIGGQTAGFLAIGAMFGVFTFLTGVFALYRPDLSRMLGAIGVVLAILSLFGSLGGLLFGMLFGIIGGNLCIAWRSEEESSAEGGEDTSEPGKPSAMVAKLRGIVGKEK